MSTTYSFVDGPWVTSQFLTPWRTPTHLDGQETIGDDRVEAFINTESNLLPVSRLYKLSGIAKLTAPRFSQIFKGTLARLAPKTRGWIIKNYNKYVFMSIHSRVIKASELTHDAVNNNDD